MSNNDRPIPSYSRVGQWVKEYGVPGSDDMRGIRDFREIEANETISALKGELYALSQGNFNADTIHQIVGQVRKQRHGSYEEWARSMLRWMSTT